MLETVEFAPVIAILLLLAQNPDADFARAQQLHQSGQVAAAESAYRAYLKQYGPRAEVLANLGALEARQEKYADAIRSYQQALRLAPALTPIRLNLGLAHFKSGNLDEAIAEFSNFLEANPGHAQARQLRAVALFERERYPESVKDYEALMPTQDTGIRLGLATAYLRTAQADKARPLLAPLLENARTPEIQLVIAQLYLLDNRLEDASRVLEQANTVNPKFPGLQYYRGLVSWRLRHKEDALAAWRAELARDPNAFQPTLALGGAIAMTAQPTPAQIKEAEQFLRRALALRPANPTAQYLLAKFRWQQAKDPVAVGLLEKAVQTDAGYREAHYLLGTVYQSLGRRVEAEREFAIVKKLAADENKRAQELFEFEQPDTQKYF